jgi:pyridoxine kinase
MPTVLIVSSLVAASPVGGAAQAALLGRMGLETMLVPTVLFGRHPGLGAPGGGPVAATVLADMLEAIAATKPRPEAVLAGYFADPDQVGAAAFAIDLAKRSAALAIVDPIMGDLEHGLYVAEATAAAVIDVLAPRADLLCPNAWELGRMVGAAVTDLSSARRATDRLACAALVSSIPLGDDIGVLLTDGGGSWLARHRRVATLARGAGDRLTAGFLGHRLLGASAPEALTAAVEDVAAWVAGRPLPVVVDSL